MQSRQHVLPLRKRIEKRAVQQVAPAHVEEHPVTGTLVGQKKILRHGVLFIPRVGLVLMRAFMLFFVGERAIGHMRLGRLSGRVQDRHGGLIAGPGVRIEQAADQLVIGITRITQVDEKPAGGLHGLRIAAHQAFDFRAGWLRTSDSREASQRRNILSKARSRTEIVVPPAHVLSGCGQSGALPVDLQQAILAQVQKEGMILVELPLQRTVQQFDGAIREYSEIRNWTSA